jgi:hypothetical protein
VRCPFQLPVFAVAHLTNPRLPRRAAPRRFLGTNQIDYTVPSITGLHDRHYDSIQDLAYDVASARIWGGIHYRSAVEDGIKLGMKVADQVLAHHFHETE